MPRASYPVRQQPGQRGAQGSSSMTRRCIFFVVVPALLVIIFVKEGCLLLFLLLPRYSKGLLFPRSSKTFQDLPESFEIFLFAKEGDLLFLLLPRSSKVCLFQDVPKFSKTFQNFPKGCFSQNLLRVFNLFTSTISQSFF